MYKGQFRLGYILTPQLNGQICRGLVSKIPVRRPPEERGEPDHNFVVGSIRLLGRFAPNDIYVYRYSRAQEQAEENVVLIHVQ